MSEWNDADEHAERAQRFYRAGQWEHALRELREALDQRPDEGEWLFGLGLTLDALQRYDEAAEAFEQALQHRGEDVPGLLHLGIDLIRAGQPERAIHALERANQLDPNVELGYVHRILAYALLDRHEDAEVMFYLARQHAPPTAAGSERGDQTHSADDAKQLPTETDEQPASAHRDAADGEPAPDDEPPFYNGDLETQSFAYDYLAQSLLARGELDRATWCWHEALQLDPAHPEANRSLALLHQQRGQTERARLYFQRQLRLDPDDVDTLLDFADMLFDNDRLAEAGEKYRRALDCDGTLAIAQQRLGDLALINGHLAAAIDRYERARQLDPSLPGIHLGLASAVHQRGDDERARLYVAEELEREGQSAEQVIDLAGLLIDLNLYHEAERLLNPLVSGADDLLMNDNVLYASALLCRGVARIEQGKLEDGATDCERCLKLSPGNVTALLQLAEAQFKAGDLDAARRWLREGLETSPHHGPLRSLNRKVRWARFRRGVRRFFRNRG
ncbi:MAG: tetratricopeptide repeat protein [Planctomycetota bacterium]